MNDIPIFDSLTHPTMNGRWMHEKYGHKNTLDELLLQMSRANIKWAFAVGMGVGIGAYIEDKYAQYINSKANNVFPVAFMDYNVIKDQSGDSVIQKYIERLVDLGYRGIKIHPRIANVPYLDPRNAEIIKTADQQGLNVLLCTYPYHASSLYLQNTIDNLFSLLLRIENSKLILLHGGAVQLMQVCEIARHFPNVLVDLSFTLCKYEKSSIDDDIFYLFNSFDRRICIGSDSPEFSPECLRNRFNYFSIDLDVDKKVNIAYKNLLEFSGETNDGSA
jgi:predicted TIM-barrel fold metal-dependent hydrolase